MLCTFKFTKWWYCFAFKVLFCKTTLKIKISSTFSSFGLVQGGRKVPGHSIFNVLMLLNMIVLIF